MKSRRETPQPGGFNSNVRSFSLSYSASSCGGRFQCLVVFTLVATIAACATPEKDTELAAPAPVSVAVATVQRGEMSDVLVVTGRTVPATSLDLASPVAGRVTALSVLPGDRVEAGATVARVLPLESEAALHGFALLHESGRGPAARGLADIPLHAPFAAVVSGRSRNPGEQVSAGDVLLELIDPASLYVIAQIPARKSPAIVPGLHVEVTDGGATLPGRVRALLPTTTPEALTVPVRISMSRPLEPALAGAAVRCRIELAKHHDVLIVPRTALVSSTVADRGTVLVDEQGRARERAVRLGLRTADRVEVTDGLREGDVVLVGGHYSLPDGTAIQATQAGK